MAALLLSLFFLQPAPADWTPATACELMWGAEREQVPALFDPALTAAREGRFPEALASFLEISGDLSAKGEEVLFFKGVDEKNVRLSRAFLDTYVSGKAPVLHIRRDRLTLEASLLAWGAWLACRAGDREAGMVLLRSGWRDWAENDLLTDAAFLNLALGPVQKARDFVPEQPAQARDMISKALFLCLNNEPEKGREWLDVAGRKCTDERVRQLLPAVRRRCHR